jgi:hypothetical protein
MSLRQQAIKEYNEKYPHWSPRVKHGGLGGYGTHLETWGGRKNSEIFDKWLYHVDKCIESEGKEKYFEFIKSLKYAGLSVLYAIPTGINMFFETRKRKLTDNTRF